MLESAACLNLILQPGGQRFPLCLQWKAEIQDFCPSTRVLLIGCKTDLRTDVCTRMELSHQKQAPISQEQVSPPDFFFTIKALCLGFHLLLALLSDKRDLLPSFHRVHALPSSSELLRTWSARPSRQRRASTAFSVAQLWPARTNCRRRKNSARSAASPKDCYTCPARQSCCPPASARTSPKAAPSCEDHCDVPVNCTAAGSVGETKQ